MSGATCPFAGQWRQHSIAEAATSIASATASATATREGTDTGEAQSSAGSTTPAQLCPLGFGDSSASTASSPSSQSAEAVCPLGFGRGTDGRPTAASVARSGLPRMPLAVLAGHPTLVALKGVIFDVSPVEELARWAGHDASRLVAVSAGAGDVSDVGFDAGLEGLRYEEHQKLEACFLEMARAGRAVAVLTDRDYARIFGSPLISNADDTPSAPAATSVAINANGYGGGQEAVATACLPALAAELHASVERGDAEAVTRVLSEHQLHMSRSAVPGVDVGANEADEGARRNGLLIECACPRTGMTPLLKAVEGGSEGVVRVLLEAGADVRSQAALYDDDDALSLSKRFCCSDSIVEMVQRASSQDT
ncbi:unnamed protein product [Hapterophycus canaliculatus]